MTDLNDDNPGEIDITEIPKPDRADIAHLGAKVILSAVPHVGGSAAELFDFVVTPSITRRRDKLVQTIGTRLIALEQRGVIDIHALMNNEAFVTILLQALQIGMRNHREEKLHAIQNIVLNSAVELDPEEDLKIHFLNLIDSMTALHLVLFIYSIDPKTWVENNPSIKERLAERNPDRNPIVPIAWIFPELEGQEQFVNTIFNDLLDMNLLIAQQCLDTLYSGTSGGTPVSDFGRKFLACISPPVVLEGDEDLNIVDYWRGKIPNYG